MNVQELLDADTYTVPSILKEQSTYPIDVSVSPQVFYSPEYVDLELQHIWKKTWLWACREEQMPSIGDYTVFDLLDISIVLIRTTDGIKAFYNSCLHRGTQLLQAEGNCKTIQCPFHAWTWNLQGHLSNVPCEWDFHGLDKSTLNLPQVHVAVWEGFVFINLDSHCEALDSYLDVLPRHMREFTYRERSTVIHVRKEVGCNWKVALEAFLESYHVKVTHPRTTPFVKPESQCDLYNKHSRLITAVAINERMEQRYVAQVYAAFNNINILDVPDIDSARVYMANVIRKSLGKKAKSVSDSELLDVITYFVFPNSLIGVGLGLPLQFRFTPNGHDSNSSIIDLLVLSPNKPKDYPKIINLGLNDPWSNVIGLSNLAHVLDEDMLNLPRIQKGLKTSIKANIILSDYQESRIRHFHQTYNDYLRL